MAFLLINGDTVEINAHSVVIGRQKGCDIQINNTYVSRKHAKIFKEKSHWYIEDLGSTYGTTLNGKTVEKPTRLEHNDVIMLGPVKIVFLLETSGEKRHMDMHRLLGFLEKLRNETDKAYKEYFEKLTEIVKDYEDMVKENRMLTFLLSLVERFQEFNTRELLSYILKETVAITGAERAMVLHIPENKAEYTPLESYGTLDFVNDPLPRSIVERVLEIGEPIIIENAVDDPDWGVYTSILNMNIRSLLAFPIMEGSHVKGIIYMENRSLNGIFTRKHLELVKRLSTHIASILSLYREQRGKRNVLERIEYLREKFDFTGLIGKSEGFLNILELVSKVAPTDTPVLLMGESGTGKELVARAIHKNSKRKDKPFVVINCATIPKELFEAELFGYSKGAFSGAYRNKIGKVEMADGGTIFFDELAELPPETQAKLLRLIQFNEIEPLGTTRKKRLDIRIISATSRPLNELLKTGKFREDLYYRLNVFQIYLPPLRERREDIPLLAEHFAKSSGKNVRISKEAMKLLLNYDYPGNIRELENIITRAIVMAAGSTIIKPEHLPEELREMEKDDYKNPEKLREVLEKTHYNIKKTAEILGISRRHLYRLMEKYGIRRK